MYARWQRPCHELNLVVLQLEKLLTVHEMSFCSNAERRQGGPVRTPGIKNKFKSRLVIDDLLASVL